MNDIPRLMPWIGGTAEAGSAAFSPLVSPIDESVASHMVESDAGIIDAQLDTQLAVFERVLKEAM